MTSLNPKSAHKYGDSIILQLNLEIVTSYFEYIAKTSKSQQKCNVLGRWALQLPNDRYKYHPLSMKNRRNKKKQKRGPNQDTHQLHE
ncbi:hypothetical protein DPMN_116358 [Dreissena polymorpha]|uniref:Uncharacterized protein n=1 Tax=Dreissena polymorpha TaxID=45954 RepID=A0A9D4KNU1_DREPO|nr:hypothetical protein DPMN_116358 [Dreissena polymorpha]